MNQRCAFLFFLSGSTTHGLALFSLAKTNAESAGRSATGISAPSSSSLAESAHAPPEAFAERRFTGGSSASLSHLQPALTKMLCMPSSASSDKVANELIHRCRGKVPMTAGTSDFATHCDQSCPYKSELPPLETKNDTVVANVPRQFLEQLSKSVLTHVVSRQA